MQRHTVTCATIHLRVWSRNRKAFCIMHGETACGFRQRSSRKNTKKPLRILQDIAVSRWPPRKWLWRTSCQCGRRCTRIDWKRGQRNPRWRWEIVWDSTRSTASSKRGIYPVGQKKCLWGCKVFTGQKMLREKFIKPDNIKHNIAGISKINLLTKKISWKHISRKSVEKYGCQGEAGGCYCIQHFNLWLFCQSYHISDLYLYPSCFSTSGLM